MRRWLVLAMLTACTSAATSSSPQPQPCSPSELAGCEDCGPGEIRRGIVFDDLDGVGTPHVLASRIGPDGSIVCVACASIFRFDSGGKLARRDDLALAPGVHLIEATLDPAGALYVGALDDTTGMFHAIAVDANDQVRWQKELGGIWRAQPFAPWHLLAAPEGPYLIGTWSAVSLTSYVAADGSVGWRTELRGGSVNDMAGVVVPDDAGKVYVATNAARSGPGTADGSLSLVDAKGIRSSGVSVSDRGTGEMSVLPTVVALTAEGGAAIAGSFEGESLNVGGALFTGAPGTNLFVAVLDATGTMWRWAFSSHPLDSRYTAMAVLGDEVLLARSRGEEGGVDLDLVGSGGLVRSDSIRGDGNPVVNAITAAPDGTVWIDLLSQPPTEGASTWQLSIGSQVFTGDRPRHYIVNLLP